MLNSGDSPEGMLERILDGLEMEKTDTLPVQFHCSCEKKRVEKAIISIGRKEIEEMIAEKEPITVNCHFCNTDYTFTVEELKDILKKAVR